MKPAAALVLFLAAARVLAHDFWIEPTSFRPEVGSTVGLALRVGQGFRGDPVPRMPESIEKFVTVSRAGEKPVEGAPGRDPAGVAGIAEPGWIVVGYRSRPKPIELPAEKFEQYLKEEGLESVIAARAARGDSQKPGNEIYSRSAKSLLDANGADAGGAERVLGFRLELVPEKSPKAVEKGRPMPVRLLFEGKPLAGALVVAINREDPEKRLSARSNGSGRVSLDLTPAGVWLVKAVHMVPAPASSGAEWESLWASLTFEIR
ncbi:MAG TPA: DUF4198 domain-containing protein [Thermoanaerobaculia bacterium]|jgi:uncharacterized GH25 family protein|nr:DUF4198 domain-containing protein [Thermoanaerobaculia bacterium]